MFKQGKMMNKKEKTNRRKINLPLSPFFPYHNPAMEERAKGTEKSLRSRAYTSSS
jgi:hypothetical protein